MRISFTDQWQTLFDENGKPLIGRVKFFNADSTQYKSIFYDMQGETQGENPQYTLQDGRLEHQIFLDTGVYTCRVEKFTGTDIGSMRDHANEDTYWNLVKEFKAYGGSEESEGGGDLSSGFCDTIADLRLVDPSEHGVVSVVGYYSKEDGIEPRTYVWVEGNNDAEDYGSTIVTSVTGYTTAGRWKLCETPVLCATTFGVFPDMGSTISTSELSDKATALATFSNGSALCKEVFFNAGHYIFASGTRLTFNKPVTTSATETNKIIFDMEGYLDVPTPIGTIVIKFAGGFSAIQDSKLSNLFLLTTISFGKGFFKTSWINGDQDCLNACSLFSGLTCFLNDNKTNAISGSNNTFNNWKFIGSETNENHRTIASNTTFKDCEFVGKCFSNCGTGVSFIDCGLINQNQITDNDKLLNAFVIWNIDGTPKSQGTKFIVNKVNASGQSFTDKVDNSVVIPSSGALFRSNYRTTLKYFNDEWKLDGLIDFDDSTSVFFKMYVNSDDAVNIMLSSAKKNLDLQGESVTYTRVLDNVAKTFRFVNGDFVTILKTGTGTAIDTIKLKDCSFFSEYGAFIFDAEDSSIYGYSQELQKVSLNIRNCHVSTAQNKTLLVDECYAEGCSFNGAVKLIANSHNILEQKFIGCDFNKPVYLQTASGAVTLCNIVVNSCNFNVDNSGSPLEAFIPTSLNSGTWANESLQGYNIEGNTFVGDVYLRPVKITSFMLTSSTDGSTTPTASWDVSIGTIDYLSYSTIPNFKASVQKFSDYSFFASKVFQLGSIDAFVVKAKPLTQVGSLGPQPQDIAEIIPLNDRIQYTKNGETSTTEALYMTYGDELTIQKIQQFMPTIDWLVEFEKV